jgi:hypothetical protein
MMKKMVMKKTEKRQYDAVKAVKGLLKIAKLAMPDSYFESDSRVRYALKYLKSVTK